MTMPPPSPLQETTSIGLSTGRNHYEVEHGHPDDAKDPARVVQAVLLQRTFY